MSRGSGQMSFECSNMIPSLMTWPGARRFGMKARSNRRKDDPKDEVFEAYLKLQLAEMGYMLPHDEERFGLLLKTARQLRGLSQAQLAARSEVTETTISRLERDLHTAQKRTVRDLVRALE